MRIDIDGFEEYLEKNGFEIPIYEEGHGQDLIQHDLHCPCGKDVYLTYNDAAAAIKQRGKRGGQKFVYKCELCGHYHLSTKQTDKGRQKKRFQRTQKRSQNKSIKTFKSFSNEDVQKAVDNSNDKKKRANNHYGVKAKKDTARPMYQKIFDSMDEEILKKFSSIKNDTERTDGQT